VNSALPAANVRRKFFEKMADGEGETRQENRPRGLKLARRTVPVACLWLVMAAEVRIKA